jgi:hypothetical protein
MTQQPGGEQARKAEPVSGPIYSFLTSVLQNMRRFVNSWDVFMMQRLIDVVGLTVFICLSATLVLAVWA